jgi:hypothetical protein
MRLMRDWITTACAARRPPALLCEHPASNTRRTKPEEDGNGCAGAHRDAVGRLDFVAEHLERHLECHPCSGVSTAAFRRLSLVRRLCSSVFVAVRL